MGRYFIYQCGQCGATILQDTRFVPRHWSTFDDMDADIPCCSNPRIGWVDNVITTTLPDNDEIPEPEPELPRRSRVELVLEDY